MKHVLILSLLFFISIAAFGSNEPIEVIAVPVAPYLEADSDTIMALNNFFQRKRKGSRTGAVIFGTLAGVSLVAGITSGLAGNFLLAGAFGVLTITSASKGKKYSAERLEQIITDYQNGKGLPPEILQKLKAKDFQ